MIHVLHILAEAAATPAPASPLPDPKSFAAVGWLVLTLAALAVAFNQGFAMWKNIRPKPARGGNVGREEFDEKLEDLRVKIRDHKTDLENRITDVDRYAHTEVHNLQTATANLRLEWDGAHEGLHNRLFAQAELLNYLRGQIEGLMMAARSSAESANRAAQATERAAAAITRGDHLTALSNV